MAAFTLSPSCRRKFEALLVERLRGRILASGPRYIAQSDQREGCVGDVRGGLGENEAFLEIVRGSDVISLLPCQRAAIEERQIADIPPPSGGKWAGLTGDHARPHQSALCAGP